MRLILILFLTVVSLSIPQNIFAGFFDDLISETAKNVGLDTSSHIVQVKKEYGNAASAAVRNDKYIGEYTYWNNKGEQVATRFIRKDGVLESPSNSSESYGIDVGGKQQKLNGKVMSFYSSRVKDPLKQGEPVKWILFYKNNQRQGEAVKHYKSGEIETKLTYKNDLIEGKAYTYYKSGKPRSDLNYIKNKQEGLQVLYYETGEIKGKIYYTNNKEDYGIEYYKDGFIKYTEMPLVDGQSFTQEFDRSHKITSMTHQDLISRYDIHLEEQKQQKQAKELEQIKKDKATRNQAQLLKQQLIATYDEDRDWITVKSIIASSFIKGTKTLGVCRS